MPLYFRVHPPQNNKTTNNGKINRTPTLHAVVPVSYTHLDIEVFDYLLSRHDELKWDFVQIQLNYVDWRHAKEVNTRNTDAEYLYAELVKRNIPAVIMEPLLGGRLSRLNDHLMAMKFKRYFDRSKRQNSIYRPPSIVADLYYTQ